jgi:hypothetical protein
MNRKGEMIKKKRNIRIKRVIRVLKKRKKIKQNINHPMLEIMERVRMGKEVISMLLWMSIVKDVDQ